MDIDDGLPPSPFTADEIAEIEAEFDPDAPIQFTVGTEMFFAEPSCTTEDLLALQAAAETSQDTGSCQGALDWLEARLGPESWERLEAMLTWPGGPTPPADAVNIVTLPTLVDIAVWLGTTYAERLTTSFIRQAALIALEQALQDDEGGW